MEQSMRRFMKVGLVLHAAYRGLGDGGGPILECLGKVVQDDYFDAVEVAHIHDPDVSWSDSHLRRIPYWFRDVTRLRLDLTSSNDSFSPRIYRGRFSMTDSYVL